MMKGMSVLKICNVISIAMAIVLFVLLAVTNQPSATLQNAPYPYMPIVYALFNFTMSLSLTCKLGAKSGKLQNVLCSALSAVIIAAMLIVTACLADFSQPLPTLSNISNPYLKVYAVITVALACMCGIVGCALPVCELVNSVVDDKTVSAACVFGLACAFSMFGFDFLVRYGYVFVALIGTLTVITTLVRQRKTRSTI